MPWHALAKCIDHPAVARASSIPSSPIVSVWFDLDPELVSKSAFDSPPAPLNALIGGGPFHFLYRRPSDPVTRFAVLNGGGVGLEGLDADGLIHAARQQVAHCFPEYAPAAETGVARVTKENAATIVARPGREDVRPEPGLLEGLANLVICGDWTATNLPSTLEGAAESAVTAVGSVITASSFAPWANAL